MKSVTGKRRIINLLMLAAIPIVFYSCADSMIFHPPSASYKTADHFITIPTAKEQKIASFYFKPVVEDGWVVLFSHGNAEDIGHMIDFAELYHRQGFGILIYDYRGYGLSDGKPSEKNTYEDIDAAYRFLTDTAKIAPTRIIVHGRSVGSGPSTWLAERYPVGGLILESPFVSAFRVVTRWPILPFDRYKNLSRIRNVHCPVLIIHGKRDRIVPFWHGQALYQAANEPKQHYWIEEAGHNNVLYIAQENYWKAVRAFEDMIIKSNQ